MPLSVQIIRTLDGLANLRPQWNTLLERCQPHAVFLTPEWMITWWEVYGDGARLFVLAVWEHGRLVGILPSYITAPVSLPWSPATNQLRLLGTTAVCSDHLDGLVEAGRESQVVRAWQSTIAGNLHEWESLELADLAEEGILSQALLNDPTAWGKNLTWTTTAGLPCPYIPLPHTWEVYLASLSAKTRREIRHDRRALEGNTTVHLQRVSDSVSLDHAMTTFINLHQMRREHLGEVGIFRDERFHRFHQIVSRRLADRGWLRLWILHSNAAPAAARYEFAYRGRVYDYLPGHDPQWAKFSVGLVLLSHCVEQAILIGDCEFDLLRGDEEYKSRWASQTRRLVTYSASPPFTRAWIRQRLTDHNRRLRETAKTLLPERTVEILRGRLRRNKLM